MTISWLQDGIRRIRKVLSLVGLFSIRQQYDVLSEVVKVRLDRSQTPFADAHVSHEAGRLSVFIGDVVAGCIPPACPLPRNLHELDVSHK